MLHTTQGIVLGKQAYGERFYMARVFTRHFGRVSYLVPKTTSRKAKVNVSLFFPLSMLELEVEHSPLRDVQYIKEATRSYPLYNICTDPVKVSISFFLAEFLSKTLRQTVGDERLFDYLYGSVSVLENCSRGASNFHLAFMSGLAKMLGVYPNTKGYKQGYCFDLMNAEFVHRSPLHTHYIDGHESAFIRHFGRINFRNMHLFRLSHNNRNVIIEYILDYYRLHVCSFSSLKSLEVLRAMS